MPGIQLTPCDCPMAGIVPTRGKRNSEWKKRLRMFLISGERCVKVEWDHEETTKQSVYNSLSQVVRGAGLSLGLRVLQQGDEIYLIRLGLNFNDWEWVL